MAEALDYYIRRRQLAKAAKRWRTLCDICQKEISYVEIRVDHDHDTGRARGYLCNKCNVGLGFFQDNITILARATAYLQKHKPESPVALEDAPGIAWTKVALCKKFGLEESQVDRLIATKIWPLPDINLRGEPRWSAKAWRTIWFWHLRRSGKFIKKIKSQSEPYPAPICVVETKNGYR